MENQDKLACSEETDQVNVELRGEFLRQFRHFKEEEIIQAKSNAGLKLMTLGYRAWLRGQKRKNHDGR